MDPMDVINAKIKQQAGCKHHLGWCGVWPHNGTPRLVCNACGLIREMTPDEITQHEREIKNGL